MAVEKREKKEKKKKKKKTSLEGRVWSRPAVSPFGSAGSWHLYVGDLDFGPFQRRSLHAQAGFNGKVVVECTS